MKKVQVGLLGLGSVGRKVLEIFYAKPSEQLELMWTADSKRFFRRKDGEAFTRKNLRAILQMKENESEAEMKQTVRDDSIEIVNFSNTSQEVSLVKDEIADGKWIAIDSTYSKADTAYEIATRLFDSSIFSFITASKTAWANHDMCLKLYSKARETKTFLGLNCTLGVWVDQMEYLPLFLKLLGREKGLIAKRDNSSLNLFFTRLNQGWSPKKAFENVVAGGYLEPGAINLVPEVRDQIIKLKAAANLCSAMTGFVLEKSDRASDEVEDDLVSKADNKELAKWFISGRKDGHYPALLSSIAIDGDGETINLEIKFSELDSEHVLAKDFPGKNAVSVRKSGRGSEFAHAGYGGAPKTATKLIWEAERVSRLSDSGRRLSKFEPMPIITAVELHDPDALQKQASIVSMISK